jgi:hypothetical protein
MSDTPLRLKPHGFFSGGFSLPYESELRERRRVLRPWVVPCHRLLGSSHAISPDTFEYVVGSFDTHARTLGHLSAIHVVLVYLQRGSTRECFYRAPFVL